MAAHTRFTQAVKHRIDFLNVAEEKEGVRERERQRDRERESKGERERDRQTLKPLEKVK